MPPPDRGKAKSNQEEIAMRSLYMLLSEDEELRLIAARHNVSKSDLIRGAVSLQLKRLRPKPNQANANEPGAANLQVLKEVLAAGHLRSGSDADT
jgi:hypothetical protein